ncbi:MAG: aminoglycoside adenylyltransferase domain-containing protein, partial [Acidimicrobiia bacterium]
PGAHMSIPLDELPPAAAEAALRLRRELTRILGDDLVGLWVDGGTTFPDRPLVPGDLDVCAVVTNVTPEERDSKRWHDDPESRPARLLAAQQMLEAEHGRHIDAVYLLLEEMGRHERPGTAFDHTQRENRWAIVREHWLAGQYVHLLGHLPEDVVAPPRGEDTLRDLSREIEHLERHVYEGDAADPYEATFAMWNGSRVLHTLTTGNAVVSKRSAGDWALDHLPERWHPALHAAGRSYDGVAAAEDDEILRVTMPSFVAMIREQLPYATPRPPGYVPRWG